MNKKEYFLTVILEGESVKSGRIPVSYLLEFLASFQKVLYRIGESILCNRDSTRKGPKPKDLKSIVEIDLVEITHGSPSTLLCFDKRMEQAWLLGEEIHLQIFETFLKGLKQAQTPNEVLPNGFDRGVLFALRDMGKLFHKQVKTIKFKFNPRPQPLEVKYTPEGFDVIQKHILGTQSQLTTIEGRLIMADFKEEGMRLRIHPPIGEPVFCIFYEEQKEEVLENLLRRVRISGEAIKDPLTGKINKVRIHDIEPLEEFSEAIKEIPFGTEQSYDFWKSWTLEDLAKLQEVQPITDITALYSTWPGESDDGFEQFIHELRQVKQP